MGPPQRIAGPALTAFSQDPPWVCLREQNSLVKNRMRGIRTSGSVRGGDGNIPTYSAAGGVEWRQSAPESRRLLQMTMFGEEGQLAGGERLVQVVQEQPPKQARQHLNREEEPRPAR